MVKKAHPEGNQGCMESLDLKVFFFRNRLLQHIATD